MTVALIVFLVLLFTGIPLYVDLGLSSFLYIFMTGMKPIVVLQRITQAANSFTMIAAPFFILILIYFMMVAMKYVFYRGEKVAAPVVSPAVADDADELAAAMVALYAAMHTSDGRIR